MERFLDLMQNLDRRFIYLVIGILLVVMLLLGKPETGVVLEPTQRFFDTVQATETTPESQKIITIGVTFAANTLAENGNQFRAVVRHLMLTNKRFAIMAVGEPQGAANGPRIVKDLAAQYGYTYGTDWIDFGYQLNSLAFYKLYTKDIPAAVKTDGQQGKPIATFPIMAGITSVSDHVAMHIEVTASASIFSWISIVQPATHPRLKIGYACTGVMTSEAYPLLDSNQITGLMAGLKGAADYEQLVDGIEAQQIAAGTRKTAYDAMATPSLQLPQPARVLMFTQSSAHLAIIIFIIIGNVGLLLATRRRKEAAHD
jgi:hypothetical protein